MSLLLCTALYLYSGPIQDGTPVAEVSHQCRQTKVEAARKAIAACAKQGAERCEVIVSADRKVITLESKVQVSQ